LSEGTRGLDAPVKQAFYWVLTTKRERKNKEQEAWMRVRIKEEIKRE